MALKPIYLIKIDVSSYVYEPLENSLFGVFLPISNITSFIKTCDVTM